MDSIATILQAMMQQAAPRVTPMGAAPSGGGGMSVPAVKGSGFSRRSPQAEDQYQNLKFTEPEISAYQDTPPPQAGWDDPIQTPYRRGQQPSTDPADPMGVGQGKGDPVEAALRRQFFEAEQAIERAMNPETLLEKKEQGKNMRIAKGMMAQFEINRGEWQRAQEEALAAQEQAKVKQVATAIAGQVEQQYGREEADAVARSIMANPELAEKYATELAGTYEKQRATADERAFLQAEEDEQSAAVYRGLVEGFQIDRDIADAIVHSDIPLENAVNLIREGEAAGVKLSAAQEKRVQRIVDQNETSQLITQQVSAIRKDIEENWLPTTGLGGAVMRKVGRMFDKPTEGEVGLFESFFGAGEVARRNEVIKHNIALAAINNMRQFSASGGALGNVSNFEVRMVQNVKDALDPTRGEAAYLTALDTVEILQKRSAYFARNGEDMMAKARELGVRPEVFIMDNLNKQFPIDAQFTEGIMAEGTDWDDFSATIQEVNRAPPQTADQNGQQRVLKYDPATGEFN